MKENQKLILKIIIMSLIFLSCADNNVRQINYTNETVKIDEIEFSKKEKKKLNEDKILELTVKEIENSSNVNTSYVEQENKNPITQSDNLSFVQNIKSISKVKKKELNKLDKTFEESVIKVNEENSETSLDTKPIVPIGDNITQKQDENDLLAINAALAMLSKPSKNNKFINTNKDKEPTKIYPFSENVFKVGVLIPMSGVNKSIGNDIRMGIETAFFSEGFNKIEVLFFDSMNIPNKFYRLLNDKNIDLIIGPVFSDKLKEIYNAEVNIKIPILSFSNNRKLRNKNVWLLGKMQEDEIEHIIDFGVKTGISNLAIIGENTEYSKTLIFTAKNILINKGIGLNIIIFENSILNDRAKLRDKIKKLSGWKKEYKNKLTLPKPRYDGILFTGSNEFILKLAPLLSYYDLNSERVTYIGNSKFKSSELVNEVSLQGTFFSSSKEPKTDEFINEWRENWGFNPSYFSILAFDLALFAKKLSLEKDLSNYITRAQGHKWLSGEVFITEDGLNKRKQVVNLIENKKFSRIYFD